MSALHIHQDFARLTDQLLNVDLHKGPTNNPRTDPQTYPTTTEPGLFVPRLFLYRDAALKMFQVDKNGQKAGIQEAFNSHSLQSQ